MFVIILFLFYGARDRSSSFLIAMNMCEKLKDVRTTSQLVRKTKTNDS